MVGLLICYPNNVDGRAEKKQKMFKNLNSLEEINILLIKISKNRFVFRIFINLNKVDFIFVIFSRLLVIFALGEKTTSNVCVLMRTAGSVDIHICLYVVEMFSAIWTNEPNFFAFKCLKWKKNHAPLTISINVDNCRICRYV